MAEQGCIFWSVLLCCQRELSCAALPREAQPLFPVGISVLVPPGAQLRLLAQSDGPLLWLWCLSTGQWWSPHPCRYLSSPGREVAQGQLCPEAGDPGGLDSPQSWEPQICYLEIKWKCI